MTGTLLGTIAAIQLMPFVRSWNIGVHRLLGYIFFLTSTVFTIYLTYILAIAGMVPVGFELLVADWISVVVLWATLPLGLVFVLPVYLSPYEFSNTG